MKIGIVGAGTAGSTAAIVLARAGHDVTIHERVPTPGPVGAGLLMQPTGMSVLKKLGLDEVIRQRGARVERLHCVRRDGRNVFELAYEPGTCGIGVHRGVLFETLFGAARDVANVVTGSTVTHLHSAGRRKTIVCDDGREHGPYDVVVVASGSRSTVVDDEPPIRRVIPYPWGALWFVARTDNPQPVLFQVLEGTQRMLGILPAGFGPHGSTPLVTVFWSIPVAEHDAIRRNGLDAFKALLSAHTPHAAPLVDQLSSMNEVLFSAYYDVRMPRWDVGPVVYIGDAGHAMSPQLGQGANIALADAQLLGEHIHDLPGYSRRRRNYLRYYQFATRWLTPFFQGDHNWLAHARNIGMPLATRVPQFRTFMIRTMSGLVTTW